MLRKIVLTVLLIVLISGTQRSTAGDIRDGMIRSSDAKPSTVSNNPVEKITDLTHFPDPVQTDQNMSVLIQTLEGIEISPGSELACLTDSGLVCGAINLDDIFDDQWGMAVWADDATTEEIDGFVTGEHMNFVYWDAEHDWELDLTYNINRGQDNFAAGTLLVIDIMVSTPEDKVIVPLEFGITVIFPNPFNNNLMIKYSVPSAGKVEIKLFTLDGKRASNVFSGPVSSGTHQLVFTDKMLASGIYFLEMKHKELQSRQKIVLLK